MLLFFDNYILMCFNRWKYPNYEAVIPKENPNKLMIDRSQFLSSVRRIIFSNKTHTKFV
jgi:DNA polymerase-3 subunit beta